MRLCFIARILSRPKRDVRFDPAQPKGTGIAMPQVRVDRFAPWLGNDTENARSLWMP
jgi:hypothetical protein